ncbi:outer membrane transport energization protein TonB [Saccharicrinis carchari]|uniref:Outer membrane transport energization protein TonB n=1 Tax=Saccharicrinis carchari TaxID=1168039 RepID=A0A521DE74_SACCC|nr:energy transducer TonB [Saccharicrinis carchari]SMO69936.1 outer membrane transport energization protein TonB [Saccharicrinis carchari]
MEVKKSPKADLENKKSVFMQIGLVVVLAIVLIAFEWSTTDVDASTFDMIDDVEAEEEIVPITRQEEVKPPPPPPPPKVIDVLNIVDDDVELDEELDIEDTEIDEDTEIEFDLSLEEEETDDAPVFFIVEEMPEFPGGDTELRKYIAQSVKYPVIAQENGIQGRVYVQFVVGTDGGVTQVKVARGVDPNLDKEAIRVVQSMPKWKPGKQRGKAVKVSYTVPINFVLQ